jgi:hypothetical protein
MTELFIFAVMVVVAVVNIMLIVRFFEMARTLREILDELRTHTRLQAALVNKNLRSIAPPVNNTPGTFVRADGARTTTDVPTCRRTGSADFPGRGRMSCRY